MAKNVQLSRAQATVLSALEPGGILSVPSLMKTTGLTGWQVRHAVMRLRLRGLIVAGGWIGPSGYQITMRGRNTLSVQDC
jgi:RIO-like serine/threonine protein kinase